MMAKSVVVVHDDPVFTERLAEALRGPSHWVVVFPEPMAALYALENPKTSADLLITQFPAGKPNGTAPARMMRLKRPDTKVLILGKEHLAELAEGLAEFLPHPVEMGELMAAVEWLLGQQDGEDSLSAACWVPSRAADPRSKTPSSPKGRGSA